MAALDPSAAHWVHWGLSEGDVIDSSIGHVIGDGCGVVLRRLGALCHRLAELAREHRTLACAQWLQSCVFCHDRLLTMSAQWLQLGGPTGDLSAALAVYQTL